MAPFTKPEAVLKQAEGLVSVGQSHAALQSLVEMFSSKRFRSTPLTTLEPIVIRFVELCVDMRKGRTAKEGLMQYKNIAQNTSVGSIEVVINRFIQLSDAKVHEAQEKADKVTGPVDVDDLEASETPESILLGAVSGDQSKDRTDRALVTPWLKFLWESYRTSLETLKNNARLEAIYQQVAQQAFRFCLKHQRKVEFRRLCETLRLHLSNVAKYAHQTHAINLSDPETLQHHLDTRFAQLNTSVELELWQEAFRSVEDVHNLLTMAKKAPRPAMMANYYEKLTKIFLMSGNALYHAAAWGRYHAIVTSIGGKSEEEMAKLASQVLVSTLAVPVGLQGDDEDGKGKSSRLTALLGLTKAPTRAGLLKDALSRDVLRLSPAPIKSLYTLLEASFDPLTLCSSTAPLLAELCAPDTPYSGYRPLLERALLSRLLAQLSQIYSTLTISSLLDLVAPLEDLGPEQVEAFLMGCARRGERSVHVDHATGTITFIDEGFVLSSEDPVSSTSTSTETSIQPSAADLVRTRLSTLAVTLHNSLAVLYPPPKLSPEEEEAAQQAKFAELVAAANAERHALSLRRALVARRRELLSELSARKEKEEASRRAETTRREKDEEVRRAKIDMAKKERERAQKEVESIRAEEAKKLAQTLIKKGNLKVSVGEMEDMSTDSLMRMQVEQLEREKKELNQRLRTAAKRIDHIERAYRKEEQPLHTQDYTEQQATDRAIFETLQRSRIEGARQAFQEDITTKKRLSRMIQDYQRRKELIIAQRSEEHTAKLAESRKRIEEEKEKRRAAHQKQKDEEERERLEAERIRREQEEEEVRLEAVSSERRAAEEEAAAKEQEEKEKAAEARRQRDEERAKIQEEVRKRAEREAEAEAHAAQRRAEQRNPPAQPAPSQTWRRGGAPSAPARATALATPPRAESPLPAAAAAPAAGAYRPGAFGGTGGGWRDRQAVRPTTGTAPVQTASPVPPAPPASRNPAPPESRNNDDGFEIVPAKGTGVWKPRRLQGQA
ncbi:uncharacterized protein EDB91DRAFT_1220657 [Suillus paluster]|uniref:uncharacterized protein n=1 Tax=Suillus paluster TaxID=48578 RepID=UPI001B885375|nr:uncharacterized protein EDB91DRAFT_1220657 [Suillus paluster]KAG1745084.1 hypothetical protein EDB91DRAFT_1220657 [Suillus paluster]